MEGRIMQNITDTILKKFGWGNPDKIEFYEDADHKLYVRLTAKTKHGISFCDARVYRSGLAESEKWLTDIEGQTKM
jgi:hypothetical protein